MIVHQAYRYELKPNNRQKTLFLRYAGVRRFTWNWALDRRIKEYEETGKSSNHIEQSRQLTSLKKTEFPWLYDVSSWVPQNALRDLDRAYSDFFRRCREGDKKPGFPKFKKKGVHDSFRFSETPKVFGAQVQLPKIGRVRVKENTAKLKGRILNATVSREADRWFVSFMVEQERPEPKPVRGDVVGVDLGISCFAVLSDGTRIEKPPHLDRLLRLLKRRQQSLARKRKGSSNWHKTKLALTKVYMRIRCQRRDFLHKLSSLLAKTKREIVVEDLNVAGMVRCRSLARRISDVGWSMFREMLTYKCEWYGSKLTVASRFFPSTKRCSRCGHKKKEMGLGERVYRCSECGLTMDRDLNAALNLKSLAESSSVTACGEDVRRGLPHADNAASMNQEANTAVFAVSGSVS